MNASHISKHAQNEMYGLQKKFEQFIDQKKNAMKVADRGN